LKRNHRNRSSKKPDLKREYSTSPREMAVRMLARREHSALELRHKLSHRGVDEVEIDSTISRLQQEGLQSDERFAESYVHSRSGKGYGPLRIAAELRERGVDEGITETCLDRDDDRWQLLLQQAHQRKFGDNTIGDFQDRARRIRFLQYRGFELDKIYHLLKVI
jgi:regulatory protein